MATGSIEPSAPVKTRAFNRVPLLRLLRTEALLALGGVGAFSVPTGCGPHDPRRNRRGNILMAAPMPYADLKK
jgi:hypothetical protein